MILLSPKEFGRVSVAGAVEQDSATRCPSTEMNHRNIPMTGFVLLGLVSGLWLCWNSSNRAALHALREDCEILKVQIEACNNGLAAIKSHLERSRDWDANFTIAGGVDPGPAATSRIEEMLRQQSNTTALIERLINAIPGAQDPAQTAERAQQAVLTLEQSLPEFQTRLETAEKSVTELGTQLGVPPDVAVMNSAVEDDPNMRKFLPFFQAKRERDTARRVLETVQLRLLQERVDAAAGH